MGREKQNKKTINQGCRYITIKTESQRSGSSGAAAVACEASNGGREVSFLLIATINRQQWLQKMP